MTEDSIAEFVSGLYFAHDCSLGEIAWLAHQCLVEVDAEGFANGLDPNNAEPLKNAHQFVVDHRHSLEEGIEVARLLTTLHRALEVVDDREDATKKVFVSVERILLALLMRTTAEVVELRECTDRLVTEPEVLGL